MKKNKLTYLSVLTLLFINLFLFSCNDRENIEMSQKKEPELFKDFNLIDGNNSHNAKEEGPGVKVTLTIGRKSKKCRKIGICKS
jgi:ABC-type oligopeptide transport system substrate-binding subunit